MGSLPPMSNWEALGLALRPGELERIQEQFQQHTKNISHFPLFEEAKFARNILLMSAATAATTGFIAYTKGNSLDQRIWPILTCAGVVLTCAFGRRLYKSISVFQDFVNRLAQTSRSK